MLYHRHAISSDSGLSRSLIREKNKGYNEKEMILYVHV